MLLARLPFELVRFAAVLLPEPEAREPLPPVEVLVFDLVCAITATAARIDRLIRFASDALDLADCRADLDLRALIDDVHADLIQLQEER